MLPAGAIGPDGRAAIIRDPTLTSPTEPTPPAPHSEAVGVEGAAAHPYAKVKKNHPYAHVKLPKSEFVKPLCCSFAPHPPFLEKVLLLHLSSETIPFSVVWLWCSGSLSEPSHPSQALLGLLPRGAALLHLHSQSERCFKENCFFLVLKIINIYVSKLNGVIKALSYL